MRVTDYGYYNNPDDVNGKTAKVTYEYNGKGVKLSTKEMITNADSYAGFMVQYYYVPIDKMSAWGAVK